MVPRIRLADRWIPTGFSLAAMVLVIAVQPVSALFAADEVPASSQRLLKSHCVDCHSGTNAEGGLDLTALTGDLNDAATEAKWVRIVDRVQAGEMPPRDVEPLPPALGKSFVKTTGAWIRSAQQARQAELGRVRARRLTRREVERSLQDLLGIDIPLADQLPEDTKSHGFSTVAAGQSISHFQMARHLAVVDVALDEAFRRATTVDDVYEQSFDARAVARTIPNRRCREPEMRNGQAVVWSSGLIFYGRLPATTAPVDGWYRFTVTASGLKPPKTGGVWSTVNSGLCVSSAPLLNPVTTFEAMPEPQTIEFEAWLPKGHMLEIRPGDVTLARARFDGGQVGVGEGEPQNVPGIAIDAVTMRRIHRGADDDGIRRLLFGDLEVRFAAPEKEPRKGGQKTPELVAVLGTTAPRRDLASLLTNFARRAFRRPVSDEDVADYVARAAQVLDEGSGLREALRVGYRAMLCSPRFLYLTEQPGRLDDHAIAARLSYFLTGSTPDQRLSELADAGQLHDPQVFRAETERLLNTDAGRRFVQDFAAEWLDLDQINFTEPDRKLYREYDAIVQAAMLDETHSYLQTMLWDDLPVSQLIQSDFTYLNSRLARYYSIPDVEGGRLRRIDLRPEYQRGGVLTQGAILKVTANGSTTSPVVRGVWVSERLMGVPIPPPPDSVPAIEPDIRGATSIREQLAKHRSQDSCAVCHVKIDPPGFALENFDPAGQWRDRYLQIQKGNRGSGPKIDASYDLPDGRHFDDLRQFRDLVAANPRPIAACVAEKMLVYGTGAPISFADRDAVEAIVDQAGHNNYGFRSLLHAVVSSPVFLNK